MNEQFFNKHYITVDKENKIKDGFSDAFRQPQPSDILINDKGGYQFRLFPDGEENPPLFNDMGIPLYKRQNSKVIVRTQKELDADRQALENSPANQIARLDREIQQDLPRIVAHIYDLIEASAESMDAKQHRAFSDLIVAETNKLSAKEFEIVQILNEPNSTGRSTWRQLVAERERLMGELNE